MLSENALKQVDKYKLSMFENLTVKTAIFEILRIYATIFYNLISKNLKYFFE